MPSPSDVPAPMFATLEAVRQLPGEAFRQVRKFDDRPKRMLESRGMPRFAELSGDELEGLGHYLRMRVREALAPKHAEAQADAPGR